jgi:hypothetical protein
MKDNDESRPISDDNSEWQPDASGQRRYRGKTTSGIRKSIAANDELDITLAMRSLCEARELLVAADQLIDKRERREARKAAKGQLVLARRFIDELLGRRR